MPEHHHITIGQLQNLIKNSMEEAHPLPYWIAGEVSDGKLNGKSGHFYFDLVENIEGSHSPRARVSAMIWKKDYRLIRSYFTQVTGSEITDGMKVMVKCRVCYHELYGLSLTVTDIEPSYTLGEIELQRQETLRRLEEDGVLEMNRELGFPMVLQNIAVVSSATAAGYQDFMQELRAGRYMFRITLFDAFMQGDAAEESIIAALESIASDADHFDAVVMIRGGGSQSDLGCFNGYRLCYHIAQFPLPVITGIGHDKDNSVADLVAAHFVKTPTAVAVFLNERMADFEAGLDSASDRIISSAQNTVAVARERVRRIGIDLKLRTSGRLSAEDNTLKQLSMKLGFASASFLKDMTVVLNELSEDIRDSARSCLSYADNYTKQRESLLAAYDPRHILERGYSIVRHNGVVLKDIAAANPGDGIEIENNDNIIEATINKIRQ